LGTVRIGLPGTISSILSVPMIGRIRRNYPQIKLVISEAMSGFVSEWLEQDRVDMAVLYSDKQTSGFSSLTLLREELVMLIPPDAAPNCPTVNEALADMPLILPSGKHGLRVMLEQKLRERNISFDPTFEVDSYANIKKLVSTGYGCSILPFHAISGDVSRGRLAYLKFDAPTLWRSAYLIHRHTRPMTQAMRVIHAEIPLIVAALLADNSWAGAVRV